MLDVNSVPAETGKQFQVNKWARFGLSILLVVVGAVLTAALNYDWTTIVTPQQASVIVVVIGLIQSAYTSLAPSAGTKVIPTGSSTSLITHKAVKEGA